VVIETLLAAIFIAAVAVKIIAGGRPVICPAHPEVKVTDPFQRRFNDVPVSAEERSEDIHALLQGRIEIMSQVA
jgi:hypothetical protein